MTAVPFSKLFSATLLTAATLGLVACGAEDQMTGSSSGNSAGNSTSPAEQAEPPVALFSNAANPDFSASPREFEAPACENADQPRTGGGVYSVNLQSASGHNIAFSVFEPANIDCVNGNPLVLHGHGYGGSRSRSPGGILKRLVENGAGVISIDQRGFGESGGTVRVLDPDFEGQDLLQILDWAEANLDWLRYSNKKPVGGKKFNMVLGATGGSYGGGYQMLIHNIDPKKRLDVLTPDIAWNDLRYSLNPGGTVKSGWALLLVAGGESGSLQPKLQAGDPSAVQTSGQDNLIRETLLRGTLANRFPEGALEFFRYHSPSYWCDSEAAGAQTFLQSEVTPGLAQKTPDPVDILFTQGFRDTLFNFNEAWHNFSCYRSLEDKKGKKADVRLITHQSGHILPLSASTVPGLADLTEQGAQNGLNEIEFQKPGGQIANGFDRFDVTQIQNTFIKTFDRALGSSQVVFVGEVAAVFVDDLPAINTNAGAGGSSSGIRYGRSAVFGGGSDAGNSINGFVTDFAWGYRLRTQATYRDVFLGTDLIPSIAWSHDVDGWSPEPGQAFNEGRQSVGLGLGFEFDANTKASITYTTFTNAADFDVLRDRDFVSLTASYSF